MLISEEEAKALTTKIFALSIADSATANVQAERLTNTRFANNTATSDGLREDVTVTIESNFGKRSGAMRVTQFDDASLEKAVRKSEEISRLAPENPEFLPPLGPQEYAKSSAYIEATAKADATALAGMCRPVIDEAAGEKVTAAGFIESGESASAFATSNGLFVYEKETGVEFTVTVRSPDGTGSGWAGKNFHDIQRLDSAALGRIAVQKCVASRKPIALEPGKYQVILESSATCDLIGQMIEAFDARSADEGRSFLSKKGGENRLGDRMFGDNITIYSDPGDDLAPGSIFATDGLPTGKRIWVENGVLKNMIYSRFWAQKQGREAVPGPTNLVMRGGDSSVEEMIKNTKRGVLVTRLWYIRTVDPQTLVLTGLTRDGSFLIENGVIAHSVKNFRFNESPVAVLNHIIAMGAAERTRGSEIESLPVAAPAIMVKDFTFSTISDAV
jgi:predicted Zn-dependent protease